MCWFLAKAIIVSKLVLELGFYSENSLYSETRFYLKSQCSIIRVVEVTFLQENPSDWVNVNDIGVPRLLGIACRKRKRFICRSRIILNTILAAFLVKNGVYPQ